ncbi:MAG: hypothetical protein MRY74_04855 [Neomegalonema sp.]|nr:hypothetical protein [Neomegalonema sp.]
MTEIHDAVKRPSGGLGRQFKQLASQPYLTIVLIGSLLLSVASFYTTFTGMLSFRNEILIVLCIVLAVQGLLFVTSWRIGFSVAERERPPIFTSLVFLICLATSALFSWEALYNHINDDASKERTQTVRLHRALESNADDLAARVAAKRDQELTALAASPAFADWVSALEKVASSALAAREDVAKARKAEAEEIAGHIAVLEAERVALLRGKASGAERAASQKRELKTLEDRRVELSARAAKLKGEYDVLREKVIIKEAELKAEESGGRAGRAGGRGKVWRTINAAKVELELQRDAKKRLYDEIQLELKGDGRKRIGVNTRIEQLRAALAAPGGAKSPKLVLLERQIADLRKRLATSGGDAFLAEVEKMRAALTGFKGRFDLAQLSAASASCRRLLDGLKASPAHAARAAALSCDEGALAAPRKAIESIDADASALALECAPGGAKAPVVAELKFKAAATHAAKCFSLSGLSASATQDLRDKIDRLIQEANPKASGHLYAINGLLYGDKLAYLTAGMAVFIDLLVLFSGLIGAASASSKLQLALGGILIKSEIDDFERALRPEVARFILDRQRALHGGERVGDGGAKRRGRPIHFSAQIDLAWAEGDPRARDGARAFLIAQVGRGLVRPASAAGGAVAVPGAPLTTTDAFILSDELMRGLRAYLETPESYQLNGLPLAGELSEDQRRMAARALRRAIEPYRAPILHLGDWAYTARIDVKTIEALAGGGSEADMRSQGKQVLLGLYAERLAKPGSFATSKLSSDTYLLKDGALELLDRAARLSAEEAAELHEAERKRAEERAEERGNNAAPRKAPSSAPKQLAAPAAEEARPDAAAAPASQLAPPVAADAPPPMTLTPTTPTPARMEPETGAERLRQRAEMNMSSSAGTEETAEIAPTAEQSEERPADTDAGADDFFKHIGLEKRRNRVLRDKAS